MARTGKAPGLELQGLADLRETFRKVAPAEADKAADETVGEVAQVVEHRLFRRLQSFANSGRLMHSLFVRRRRPKAGMLEAQVRGGATAPYMLINEFGTVHTKAQPAIVPTVEETRPELPALYREFFGKNLAKALRRRKP